MSESRTKKASLNISYNVGNKLIMLVLNFVSRTYFIRIFGVEYLGINGLFSDVLGVLSMADLGMNAAMTFSFYKPLAEGDQNKIVSLMNFYKKIYNFIAISITILGLMLIPLLPSLINVETEIPLLNVYYLFALSNVVISYLFVYKTSILTADQNEYVIVKINTIFNTLKTIFQIIIIVVFKNYILYLATGTLFSFLTNYFASRKAKLKYPFITNKAEKLKMSDKKLIINTVLSAFIFKISNVLINATDNILISIIVGTVMVGMYSNYLLVQTQIVTFYSVFFTSLTASIGNLIVSEHENKRYFVFECEQDFSYLLSTIIVPCYIGLIGIFIEVWLGQDFVLGNIVTISIGLNLFLSCTMQPIWTYREATGLYKKTKWIMMGCAFENIILSIILGEMIGIAGIIFATSISRLTTYIIYEPKLLFDLYFGRSAKTYYIGLIKNFILVSIISSGYLFILKYIVVSNWGDWIFIAIIEVIVSVAIALLVYGKSNGVKAIFQKLQMRFAK